MDRYSFKIGRPRFDLLTVAIVFVVAAIAVSIVGASYMSQSLPTVNERSSFLSTLLLCDTLVFIVSMAVAAILWYLSSARYGVRDAHSLLRSRVPYACACLMLLPIVFLVSDLAFRPLLFSAVEVGVSLALSAMGFILLAPFFISVLKHIRPEDMAISLIGDIEKEHNAAGYEGPVVSTAMQRPVLRGNAGTNLATFLDMLCEAGQSGPAIKALERMKNIALAVNEPYKDPGSIALSSSMVWMMAETAGIAAKRGRHEVIYRSVECLCDVAIKSGHQGIASLAFRSMGALFDACAPRMDERAQARLETALMEAYCQLYDRTQKREALELASAMAEKASASKMLATDEYDGILLTSGSVYRRMAEADGLEDHANKSLTMLYEALTARTAEASPLDHACITGEIGMAYMALARIKNPVKSYRSAASAFEAAGKILGSGVSPWDAAVYRGKAACAYTMLAEEYCRTKRYDDALQAARSALPLYGDPIRFFKKRSSEAYVEAASDMGLAHTIVGEVYLKSRMFDLSLKHAGLALESYASAAGAVNPRSMPERYAFIKTSMGQTHLAIAEIHFREKRYESAITACDSAIAAYNEAIRIYDGRGREKPAAAARKSLKKANDLFSTMMRIGVADRKPIAMEAKQ